MSRTHHPRPAKRTPSRHACDLVVHLDHALRSAAHILDNAPDPEARLTAETVQHELEVAREQAIALRTVTQRSTP